MRLEVGITHLLPEWEIIIQQIGLPFEIITLNESILTDQFSVIIVTRREAKFQKDVLLHYFNSGGSILTEADVAKLVLNRSNLTKIGPEGREKNVSIFSFSEK